MNRVDPFWDPIDSLILDLLFVITDTIEEVCRLIEQLFAYQVRKYT